MRLEYEPASSGDEVMVAMPFDNGKVATVVVPYLMSTDPVGVVTPPLTVTVSVTVAPAMEGFADEVSVVALVDVVVVDDVEPVTVCVNAGDVDPLPKMLPP